MKDKELYTKVTHVKNLLKKVASGYLPEDNKEYIALRFDVVNVSILKDVLPDCLLLNKELPHFWQYIKPMFSTYAERRDFLDAQFKPALDLLDGTGTGSPVEFTASEQLKSYGKKYIHEIWNTAIQRKNTDIEGAITLARTLVETVCKHILDEHKEKYTDTEELPQLYTMVASKLSLAPNQQTEDIFKQIMGSCSNIVARLGAMRNKLSDSHGKSEDAAKPTPRHAELAINLAGTMCLFLLDSHTENKNTSPSQSIFTY